MEFITLGGQRFLRADDVSSIIEISSLSSKAYIQKIKEEGLLIDVSGTKTVKTAIITKHGYIILSDLKADTIKARVCNVTGAEI